MATEVSVRRLAKSWQYNLKFPGKKRERRAGFRTKQAALTAGKERLRQLETGAFEITFADGYEQYMSATKMKERSRDSYKHHWSRIEPVLGHLLIEEVDTIALDKFKKTLPCNLSPRSINLHLALIRAVLGFMWKRGKLTNLPYIPKESPPRLHQEWYTQQERDQLLDAMFRMYPQWYLFFYITCRLGLRRGEVYALTHRQVRHIPPHLLVDQQLQQGTRERPAKLITRKNDEAYSLDLTKDVLDAIDWHINAGYAGDVFLFSKTGRFPKWLDSFIRPLQSVQRETGLRLLGHHSIGRHSVASQAATGGESIRAIQAQLGHRSAQSTDKYAHLGSGAQLRVVEALAPIAPPHVRNN